jgi:hypothetical protein
LSELLEERAATLVDERRKEWVRQLGQQFESGFVVRRDEYTRDLMSKIALRLSDPPPGAPADPWTQVVDRPLALAPVKETGATEAVVEAAADVSPGSTWLVLVGSGQQKQIELTVTLDAGPPAPLPIPTLSAQPWLGYALFEPPKAGKLALRVTSPLGTREGRLLVLRADRALKRGPSPLEKMRSDWLEVLEREQGKPFTAEEVHASSQRLARLEGGTGGEKVLPFAFTAPGSYLVAAFAPGQADIDMIVRAEGSGAPLWIDNQTDPMPIGRLTVDAKGLKVEVRVVGPSAGIDFDLRVWRAGP